MSVIESEISFLVTPKALKVCLKTVNCIQVNNKKDYKKLYITKEVKLCTFKSIRCLCNNVLLSLKPHNHKMFHL